MKTFTLSTTLMAVWLSSIGLLGARQPGSTQALVKDKSLSTYAHNVKIIVQDGIVTLKGPVRSEEEKRAVEEKAAEAAGGADKIKSELEVSSKPTTK